MDEYGTCHVYTSLRLPHSFPAVTFWTDYQSTISSAPRIVSNKTPLQSPCSPAFAIFCSSGALVVVPRHER